MDAGGRETAVRGTAGRNAPLTNSCYFVSSLRALIMIMIPSAVIAQPISKVLPDNVCTCDHGPSAPGEPARL